MSLPSKAEVNGLYFMGGIAGMAALVFGFAMIDRALSPETHLHEVQLILRCGQAAALGGAFAVSAAVARFLPRRSN